MCSTLADCPLTVRVARLADDGLTIDAIADRVRLHRSSVYRRLRAAGLPRRWIPLQEAERARIADLLLADHSRRDVARATGRGLGTVARVAIAMREDGPHRRIRTKRRCPGCGGLLVVEPCLVCRLRSG